MIGPGRPLRFLLLLLGGWVTVRILLLWSPAEMVIETAARRILTAQTAIPLIAPEKPVVRVALLRSARTYRVSLAIHPPPPPKPAAPVAQSTRPAGADQVALALPGLDHLAGAVSRTTPLSGDPVGRPPPAGSPWTVSAWLVARGAGDATLAPGGTLAGSQAGLRIGWRPRPGQPVALFTRASRPLQTKGAEVALGVEVQPLERVPVRAALEQRFALEDGAAEGTALSLIGGVSDVRLAGGLRLDAYGQAGIIGLSRRAGFVDGAASIVRPVASWGETDVRLGAGLWGAAQPGLSRLDIGPRAELRLPIAGRRVRLGVEWRERVAGNARPDSGPALTLGADF